MKFKNSQLEDRYNNFWNTSCVLHDGYLRKQLIAQTFFTKSRLNENILKAIDQYYFAARNILENAVRQFGDPEDPCEDPENLAIFLQDTRKQALEDLGSYKAFLEACFKFGKYVDKYIQPLTEAIEADATSRIKMK